MALQAEAVERLAEAADGYRTLDGWIARLGLEARLGQRRRAGGRGASVAGRACATWLDPETVAAILAEETLLADPALTVDAIARAVATRFGVRLSVLRGPSRRASVVEARHLAIHLARTHTGSSFAVIGSYFGGRDPATVRHACKAAADRINADPALAAAVAALGQAWQKTMREISRFHRYAVRCRRDAGQGPSYNRNGHFLGGTESGAGDSLAMAPTPALKSRPRRKPKTISAPPVPLEDVTTIGDLLKRLGDIPPERVRLHPTPGTATEKDVIKILDRENRPCELVEGTLVEKPMGYEESAIAVTVIILLGTFVRPRTSWGS